MENQKKISAWNKNYEEAKAFFEEHGRNIVLAEWARIWVSKHACFTILLYTRQITIIYES